MKKFIVLFVLAFLLMGCSDDGEVKTTVDDSMKEGGAEATADVAGGADKDEPGMIESTFTNLKDAMTAGTPMKCTWSYTDQNGKMTGELIVSGEKFKSESSFTGSGQDFTTNSISDGTYMYMWSDMPEMKAMKMLVPDEQDTSAPDEESAQYMDLEANYNYKCTPTIAGPGTFTPPNMEFIDMSSMMADMEAIGDKYQSGEDVDMDQMQADMEAMAAQYE